MVHPVTIKQWSLNKKFGADQRTQQRVEYLIELWYTAACVLFVIGSLYFVTGAEESERPGCKLYDVGSMMFAAGSLLYIMEGLYFQEPDKRERKRHHSRSFVWRLLKSEYLDQAFYCLGSVLFLIGTLIWDPDLASYFLTLGGVNLTRLGWLKIACGLFMAGSLCFSFASFLSALTIHREHELFKEQAVVITSCYEFGGFFFIAGTMAYVPGFHCSQGFQQFGGVLYLIGSILYLIGCVISFCKRVATYQAAKEHLAAAGTIQGFVRRWRQNAGLRRHALQTRHRSDGMDDSPALEGGSPTSPGPEADDPVRFQRLLEAVSRFQEVGWQRQRRRTTEIGETPSWGSIDRPESPNFRTLLTHAFWPGTYSPSLPRLSSNCSNMRCGDSSTEDSSTEDDTEEQTQLDDAAVRSGGWSRPRSQRSTQVAPMLPKAGIS